MPLAVDHSTIVVKGSLGWQKAFTLVLLIVWNMYIIVFNIRRD